jgi:hypothetical protein
VLGIYHPADDDVIGHVLTADFGIDRSFPALEGEHGQRIGPAALYREGIGVVGEADRWRGAGIDVFDDVSLTGAKCQGDDLFGQYGSRNQKQTHRTQGGGKL